MVLTLRKLLQHLRLKVVLGLRFLTKETADSGKLLEDSWSQYQHHFVVEYS